MSVFDKVVAGWLSEVGDRLQPKIKEEILEDIKENINTYKIIDDSANSSVQSINARSKSAAEHGRGEEGHTFIAEVNQEMVNQETVNVNQYHVDPHVQKEHLEQYEESSENNVSEQHSTTAENVPQSHHLLDKIKEEVKEIEHEVKDKIEDHKEENQEGEEEEMVHHEQQQQEEKEEEAGKEESMLAQDTQAAHVPPEKKEDVTTATETVTDAATSHKPQSAEAKVSSAASRRESRQTTLLHESVAPRLMTSENRSVCETLNFYKVDTTNFDFDLEKDIDVALQRLQKGENKYLFGLDAEERAAAEAERNAVAKYGPVTFPDDCTLTATEQLDIKTIVRAMRHHFLFSTLDEETLMKCALSLPKAQYENNTHVLDAGNANDTMFFVLDGTATVTIPQVIKIHSAANDTEEEQQLQEGNVNTDEVFDKDVASTDEEESHQGAEGEAKEEKEESETHKHLGFIEKVEQAVEHAIKGEQIEKEVKEEEENEEEEQHVNVTNEIEEHNEGAETEAHDAHITHADEVQNDEVVAGGDDNNKKAEEAVAAEEEEDKGEEEQELENKEQGEPVQFMCTVERHDTFGELNILHDCFSTTCVVANSPLRCACLTREAYVALTSPITKERVERYVEFVRASHAFEQCSEEECVKIASALRTESYVAGDKIIERGVPINWVYLVVDGTLDVCGKDCLNSDDEQAPEEDEYGVQTRITPGQLAGQLEVLFGHVAAADVVVASKSATMCKLSCYHFNTLVNESIKDAMRAEAMEHDTFGYYQSVKRSSMTPAEYSEPSFDCPLDHIQESIAKYEFILAEEEAKREAARLAQLEKERQEEEEREAARLAEEEKQKEEEEQRVEVSDEKKENDTAELEPELHQAAASVNAEEEAENNAEEQEGEHEEVKYPVEDAELEKEVKEEAEHKEARHVAESTTTEKEIKEEAEHEEAGHVVESTTTEKEVKEEADHEEAGHAN